MSMLNVSHWYQLYLSSLFVRWYNVNVMVYTLPVWTIVVCIVLHFLQASIYVMVFSSAFDIWITPLLFESVYKWNLLVSTKQRIGKCWLNWTFWYMGIFWVNRCKHGLEVIQSHTCSHYSVCSVSLKFLLLLSHLNYSLSEDINVHKFM